MVVNDDDVCALAHRPTLPPVVITETYPIHGRAGKDTPHYESTVTYTSHCLSLVRVKLETVLMLFRGRKCAWIVADRENLKHHAAPRSWVSL
jgi:hypothetical protein